MYIFPKRYDVIVVGGGHAGIEAALASARLGCQALLLTQNIDTIGQMSCNPAIGGSAKGHLVREIDALGGEMGKATDLSGIQFKILNRRAGPAIWSPRAQCDKKKYQNYQKWICETTENLDLFQSNSIQILYDKGVAFGVETSMDVQFYGSAVIITTGTFLRGLLHIGSNKQSGGRMDDFTNQTLTHSLNQIGIETGKLKTGTPPRISKNSIDFSKTEKQMGEVPIPRFSHWSKNLFHGEQNKKFENPIFEGRAEQINCFLTHTTPATLALVRKNISESAVYSGQIEGVGPRYCPSIEDKIIRFSSKEKHQIFLEPEGTHTEEIYVNGFSTSFPIGLQFELIKTIKGCEKAKIIRPAYAVEYDFVFPQQLHPWLETKVCKNLFLAGQINGTSGYEEAAAQGIMAGINAALRIKNKPPLVLRRDQAYIGVLIDDLVTKGTIEPYRIFTSRAEHRLILRQDNADLRLSQIAYDIGLLSAAQIAFVKKREAAIHTEVQRLNKLFYEKKSLAKILSVPGISYKDLPNVNTELPEDVVQQVEIAVKYSGYIERQEEEVKKHIKLEGKKIPTEFDYWLISNLRTEARQKLTKIRPATIGQASRISGVSPADVSALIVGLKVWPKNSATEVV